MKIPRPLVLALASALLANLAWADENFRCGKWIASSELTLTELLAKCGEPTSRATRTDDVMIRHPDTGLLYKSGEIIVETWTFARGSGAQPMVVTIVGGRIKSIERGS